MAERTNITWCDHTFNPWIGCQEVSRACDNCYAREMNVYRKWTVGWGPHGERRRTSASTWAQPRRWNARAELAHGHGARPRVFCASLADVFDNKVPPAWRDDLWRLIDSCRALDWLLLTKRPQNVADMLPAGWPWPNVWLGTTAEDQVEFDRRWEVLAQIPAAVRFVSYEPALGPLRDVTARDGVTAPDWLICGGESGPKARDMPREWASLAHALCASHGTAFFMKQMARRARIPADLMIREFPLRRR